MKEHNLATFMKLSQESTSEDARACCFRIFSTLTKNHMRQVVKQLYYRTNLPNLVLDALSTEQSEDVICSILTLLMRLTVIWFF